MSGIALVINVYAHAVCNLSVPLATEFKTSAQSSSKPFTVGDTSTSEAQSLALKGAPPSAAQMVHLCTLHSEGRGRADRLLIVRSVGYFLLNHLCGILGNHMLEGQRCLLYKKDIVLRLVCFQNSFMDYNFL